jgi:hypothetical protein
MKIVFALPGREYSREFLMSWSDLLVQCTAKGHQVLVSQNYSSVVHFARARCLGGDVLAGPNQKPFQGKVDYDVIIWIDSDVIFSPENVFKLLDSPHDVTAGVYMMEDMKHFAVVEAWDEDYFKEHGTFKFLEPSEPSGYKKVAYSGMGFMAIRKGVVESLKYPWFWSDLQRIGDLVDMSSEDVGFCRSLTAAGHDIYIDTELRVGHQKKLVI